MAPAGWTQLDGAHNGSYYAATFVHVVTTSDSAGQYKFSASGPGSGASVLVTLMAYTGVDQSNPVDTHGLTLTAGTPTTIPSPTITTTASNDTVDLIDSFACNGTGTWTLPSGMQQITNWRWSADTQDRVAAQENVSQPGQVSAPLPVSGCGTWPSNTSASALIALRSGTPAALPTDGETLAKPLFRSESSVPYVSGNSVAIAVPSGAQPGDLLIAGVLGTFVGGAPTAPSGWTRLDTTASVTLNAGASPDPGVPTYTAATFYHVVAAGDPSGYTFPAPPATGMTGLMQAQILDYYRVSPTAPIDAHTLVEDYDGPQTITAMGLTTTSANVRLVGQLFFRFTSCPQNGLGTITLPSGSTSRNYAYEHPNDNYMAAFDLPFASGGPTGYLSTTLNCGTTFTPIVDPRFAALIALNPGPRTTNTGQPSAHYGGSNAAAPGLCNCEQHVGKPINTENGDFWETSTDSHAATFGPPLAFTRTYDSMLAQAQAASGTPGPLGYGWTDNWNLTLQVDSGTVTINQANGAAVTFVPPTGGACTSPYVGSGGSGTYCALPDVTASLTYNAANSTYTFITHPYTSYTFNSSGQLTGESGPGGAALSLTYNTPAPGAGNCPSSAASCISVTSASGRALVIGSDSSGFVTSVTDPMGRSWIYGYCSPPSSTCSSGDLVKVTDPRGNATTYTYDQGNANTSLDHDLLTVTHPNGQPGGPDAGDALLNVYNSSGQVTSQTDPAGNETTFNYSNLDSSGTGYTLSTDPDGNQTKFSYDNGVLVGRTLGYGSSSPSTWSYHPDSSTLLKDEVIDPNGNETDKGYNGNGDLTFQINPLGAVTSYAYNNFDEQTCASLALAATLCTSLSPPAAIAAGSSTITPPSAAPPTYVTYNEYDTNGNPIWTTTGVYNPGSSSASQSRTTYQLYNGQSVSLGASHDSCSASAPNSSLPCATIDPDGVVTQLGYNSDGDITSSATPDGNPGGELATTTYGYDADGEVTSTTAPKGNLSGANAAVYTTTNEYNGDGQLHSKTVSQTGGGITARTTVYDYDGDGNQISVTDPRQKVTTYDYTAGDQLTRVTDPDNQQALTCYDGDGNVAQTVPAVGVAANSLTPSSCPSSYPSGYGDRLANDASTYSYDALGDKTLVTMPAPAGQSGFETTAKTYDPGGRLTSVTAPPASNDANAANQVTTYSYDNADELTKVTTGSGTAAASTTSYCYDPNGEKPPSSPPTETRGVPLPARPQLRTRRAPTIRPATATTHSASSSQKRGPGRLLLLPAKRRTTPTTPPATSSRARTRTAVSRRTLLARWDKSPRP